MRVVILGAGGVGGYFGGSIARAGHEVRLLARGAHRDAIRSRGLEVRESLSPRPASRPSGCSPG